MNGSLIWEIVFSITEVPDEGTWLQSDRNRSVVASASPRRTQHRANIPIGNSFTDGNALRRGNVRETHEGALTQ